ncbi:chemotaxis protein CheW [Planctomycetota bacterium]
MSKEIANEAVQTAKRENVGGKFLTFILAGEEYGVEILKVQEIIGIMNITPVPRTPEFVKGVINLRGKIIPVIDLRLKFIMESIEQTEETCIIVVQVANEKRQVTMGVIVDMVSEVIDIMSEQIEGTPEFGIDLDTRFILGIGKIDDKVVIILDVDKVLTSKEIALADKIAAKCPIKE